MSQFVSPRPSVSASISFTPAEGRHRKLRLDLSEWTGDTPAAVLEAVRSTPSEELAAYPEYEPFTAELAQFLGVEPGQVCAFPGSDGALRTLVHAYYDCCDTAAVVVPSFPMYPIYLRLLGASVVEVPLAKTSSFSFDLAGIRNALGGGAKGLFVPSPTNPTGSWIEPEAWVELAQAFPRKLIVVDEAYADFAPHALVRYGGRGLLSAGSWPANLVATGSFSKSLGLAGLRIGWVVAHPSVIEVLHRVRSPYSISSVALRAASALMRQPELIAERLAAVAAGKQRLLAGLAKLNIPHFDGHANAALAFVGDAAAPITTALKERGILIRDVSHQPLLAGTLRISVGLVPQVEEALTALAEVHRCVGR